MAMAWEISSTELPGLQKSLAAPGCETCADAHVRSLKVERETEKGEEVVWAYLFLAHYTLLSQLQTKPRCGESLLKSQHDKNSWIEVAQPTLPLHMSDFLSVVREDSDRSLRFPLPRMNCVLPDHTRD